jgi:hypothetical protein
MKSMLLLALLFGSSADSYDRLVTGDHPIFYWNDASGSDVMPSHRNVVLKNGPGHAATPDGGVGMDFNGVDQCLEVPNDPQLSVPATGVDPLCAHHQYNRCGEICEIPDRIYEIICDAEKCRFRTDRDQDRSGWVGSLPDRACGRNCAIYNYELGAEQVARHARRMLR